MTNTEILNAAKRQSAVDMSCAPEDFERVDDVVVISRESDGASAYLKLPLVCVIGSFGSNAVVACDERAVDTARRIVRENKDEQYAYERMLEIARALSKAGYGAYYESVCWLPDLNSLRVLPCRYETRVLEKGDFEEFYTCPDLYHALSPKRPHLDMLAVGAYDGGKPIGLSGCSADSAELWQVGIDVLPEYRRQGVAAALTSRITAEILERGKIPFYSCFWTNLASTRNAYASGYRPAWTDIWFKRAEE